MTRRAAAALAAACLVVVGTVGSAEATSPGVAVHVDGAGVIVRLPMGPDDRLGVEFVHSVDRLPVQDWYELRDGALVQVSTRLVQYGAGMGHIHGEGVGRPAGQWWEVSGMDRHIGVLVVRVGAAPVDHRLRYRGGVLALSRCWPGRRLTVRPVRLTSAHDNTVRSGCT